MITFNGYEFGLLSLWIHTKGTFNLHLIYLMSLSWMPAIYRSFFGFEIYYNDSDWRVDLDLFWIHLISARKLL